MSMKKEKSISGVVFDIQRFSIHDGPGIRTTVFLKGCPLHCAWCHNAEGLSPESVLFYNREACLHCGRCVEICPAKAHTFTEKGHSIDFSRCKKCFACARVCHSKALKVIGKKMCAEEVIGEVLRDKSFFDFSGGGLTLSGGEPLMQGDFSVEIARLAKENGLSVCVETSGFAPKETVLAIAPFVDLFLFDFKISDEKVHQKYTGVSGKKILENLSLLNEMKKEIVLRCPIIPGCNDTREHYRAIARLAEETDSVTAIRLEPYHPYGLKKYEAVGLLPSYTRKEGMEEEKAKKARDDIQALTKKEVIL